MGVGVRARAGVRAGATLGVWDGGAHRRTAATWRILRARVRVRARARARVRARARTAAQQLLAQRQGDVDLS